VVNQVQPSVVTITTTGMSNLSPFSVPTTGAGSGFIVSSDGLTRTRSPSPSTTAANWRLRWWRRMPPTTWH
jgi:hypothetical protein